jgi:hypothetical protein
MGAADNVGFAIGLVLGNRGSAIAMTGAAAIVVARS